MVGEDYNRKSIIQPSENFVPQQNENIAEEGFEENQVDSSQVFAEIFNL